MADFNFEGLGMNLKSECALLGIAFCESGLSMKLSAYDLQLINVTNLGNTLKYDQKKISKVI